METQGEPRWRGWMQLLFGTGLALLFFYMMAPFLMPLLLGAVAALLCYPFFRRLSTKLPRGLAALLVTLGLVVLFLLPLTGLLYAGAYRVVRMVGRSSVLEAGAVDDWLASAPMQKLLHLIQRFTPADPQWLTDQAIDLGRTLVGNLSILFGTFLSSMPGFLLAFAVIVLSAYFFLVDGESFLKFLARLSPLSKERSEQLFSAFEKSCSGVVFGLFLSSGAQALIAGILFQICRLPNPIFAATGTFIMGMVPVLGSAPIWIGATVYLFLTHQIAFGILMLLGGVGISTIDNVIRSYVLKGQGQMHPLLALVSVFGAVNLFGAAGIFVGPVIAAVFVSFLRIVAAELRVDSQPL